jgi:hypothetical protein
MLLVETIKPTNIFDKKYEYPIYKGLKTKFTLDDLGLNNLLSNNVSIQIEFDLDLKTNFAKKFGYLIGFDLAYKNVSIVKIDFNFFENLIKTNWSGNTNLVLEDYFNRFSHLIKNVFSNKKIFSNEIMEFNKFNNVIKYEYWDFDLYVFELKGLDKYDNDFCSKIIIIQTKNYRSDIVIQIINKNNLVDTYFVDYNYKIYHIEKYDRYNNNIGSSFSNLDTEYMYNDKTNIFSRKSLSSENYLIIHISDFIRMFGTNSNSTGNINIRYVYMVNNNLNSNPTQIIYQINGNIIKNNKKNIFNFDNNSILLEKTDIVLTSLKSNISDKKYCVMVNSKKNNLMISEINQNGFEFRDNSELVKLLSDPIMIFGKLSKKIFGIVRLNDLGIKLIDLNDSIENNLISSGLPMPKIEIKLDNEYIDLISSSSNSYVYLKFNMDESNCDNNWINYKYNFSKYILFNTNYKTTDLNIKYSNIDFDSFKNYTRHIFSSFIKLINLEKTTNINANINTNINTNIYKYLCWGNKINILLKSTCDNIINELDNKINLLTGSTISDKIIINFDELIEEKVGQIDLVNLVSNFNMDSKYKPIKLLGYDCCEETNKYYYRFDISDSNFMEFCFKNKDDDVESFTKFIIGIKDNFIWDKESDNNDLYDNQKNKNCKYKYIKIVKNMLNGQENINLTQNNLANTSDLKNIFGYYLEELYFSLHFNLYHEHISIYNPLLSDEFNNKYLNLDFEYLLNNSNYLNSKTNLLKYYNLRNDIDFDYILGKSWTTGDLIKELLNEDISKINNLEKINSNKIDFSSGRYVCMNKYFDTNLFGDIEKYVFTHVIEDDIVKIILKDLEFSKSSSNLLNPIQNEKLIIMCGMYDVINWFSNIFTPNNTLSSSSTSSVSSSNTTIKHNSNTVYKQSGGVVVKNDIKIGSIKPDSPIVWKVGSIKGTNKNCIIKLRLLDSSKFIKPVNSEHLYSGKCRCDSAIVEDIQEYRFDEEISLPDTIAVSYQNPKFEYRVGNVIYPDKWDNSPNNACTNGIHVFEHRLYVANFGEGKSNISDVTKGLIKNIEKQKKLEQTENELKQKENELKQKENELKQKDEINSLMEFVSVPNKKKEELLMENIEEQINSIIETDILVKRKNNIEEKNANIDDKNILFVEDIENTFDTDNNINIDTETTYLLQDGLRLRKK